MAFLYCDGFDSYAATADLTKKWSLAQSPWAWGASSGRTGGGGITCAAGASNASIIGPLGLFSLNSGYLMWGFSCKLSTTPSAAANLIVFNTGSNQVYWQVDTSGHIKSVNATNWSGTGTTNIADNAWHWLEFAINISNANNAGYVYVDGVVDINGGNSLNFWSGATVSTIGFIQNNQGMNVSIDDVIIYYNSGSNPTFTQFPLGTRTITTLRPSADSAVQFTRSTGSTNFSLVNETNADGDTSYVEDGNSNDQDLYDYDNLSFTPSTIDGVMVNSYLKNANIGSVSYKQICKSGSTQSDGTAASIATSYLTKQQVFSIDPSTSTAWTKSGVDAAKFGIKVV